MKRQIAGATDAIVWLYVLICVCSESESNGSGLALANRKRHPEAVCRKSHKR